MSGFATCFASVICLLVILTGPSSALSSLQTYPKDKNDSYYQAFQTVPSPDVTAKKLMTGFLGYPKTVKRAVIKKRQTITEDVVFVMDGSGSVGRCEFKKGKEALKHMMMLAFNQPSYDTKYAAVTFGSTARVNFKFLPYSSAASEITKISYPGGWTNTQAGLAEAKKLFDDPSSGRRAFPSRRIVFLFTDGDLTLPDVNANAMKNSRVDIYVVAVGSYIYGIDKIMKVASYPPDQFLFRVKDLAGFWNIIKLIVKQVAPGRYSIVNYDPPC
ncbi:hypothetical protein ACROYT_G006637 [Oculina patagonica]